MILIDLSQTLYSVLLQNKKELQELGYARSAIFTTLLSYKKKFGRNYGTPVLAVDSSTGYWRREVFPPYKANRKKEREKSKIDWENVRNIAMTVTEELKEVLPWKVVQVHRAEADDIIGVLALEYGDRDCLILSSDKDYKQLHIKEGVVQYSPILKKWVNTNDPHGDLMELILSGDASDGIPNIKSDDDCFVDGRRQVPVTAKFKKDFLANKGRFYRDHKANYDRNELLVDMTKIPDDIRQAILQEYRTPINGNINKLYKFLVNNRMSMVLSDIDLFRVKEDDSVRSARYVFE